MGKKHQFRKPQKRRRLKETTGKLEFVNVVYMQKERIDGVENVYAVCTCGTWRSSPDAKSFGAIGSEAKAHVEQSDGKCRLRPHPGNISSDSEAGTETPDPLSEQAIT